MGEGGGGDGGGDAADVLAEELNIVLEEVAQNMLKRSLPRQKVVTSFGPTLEDRASLLDTQTC